MTAYFAAEALLPDGWARDVRIDINAHGAYAAVTANAAPHGAERLRGPVLAGLCNAHCHAFQRAMAGLAERRSSDAGSFWTWRETMYAFVERIGPDDLEAIAKQLYVESLKAGFTSVCEFHYVHNDPAGKPYANPAEMPGRIMAAADATGIGLTLLPVLYMTSDFGGAPARSHQRRFVATPERVMAMIERLSPASRLSSKLRLGVAPHSLRAVPPDALQQCLHALDAWDAAAPIHMHVAEQEKEVEDCRAWSGQRPIEWLLEHHALSSRWCVVHATHMTAAETERLARTGAVAALCPSTEANLGDGIFALGRYLEAGGSFAIGSDSNVAVSAVEELRWLEYGQRLVHRRRSIAASAATPSVGRTLYESAVKGGAQAAGRAVAGIARGERADFIVLDPESPWLTGRTGDPLLDSFVFAGNTNAIRDVYVGGAAVVADGHHADEANIFAEFRRTVASLQRK